VLWSGRVSNQVDKLAAFVFQTVVLTETEFVEDSE
jgi:hypothetical protein